MDPAIAGHPHLKHCTSIMSLEEEIKAHTRRVESGERVCFCKACPACAAQAAFKPHDCRRRTFRVLIDDMVKCLRSWILRWKCPNCGRRFTDYPPFRASAQTLHQADRLRQIQGLLGPGCFVSRCRAASRATHLSRRRQTVERAAAGPRLVRFGAQHTMALALLAGRLKRNRAGGLPTHSAKTTGRNIASRTLAVADAQVPLQGASSSASASHAGDGRRSNVPASIQRTDIPPPCNGSRLALR